MRAVLVLIAIIFIFIATSGYWTSIAPSRLPGGFLARNVQLENDLQSVSALKKDLPLWTWVFAKEIAEKRLDRESHIQKAKIEMGESWSSFNIDIDYLKPEYVVKLKTSHWLLSEKSELIAPVHSFSDVSKFDNLIKIEPGDSQDASLVKLQLLTTIEFVNSLKLADLEAQYINWQRGRVVLRLRDWPVDLVLPKTITGEELPSMDKLAGRIKKLKKYYQDSFSLEPHAESSPDSLPSEIDFRYQDQAIISYTDLL